MSSAIGTLTDPHKVDLIAALGETIGKSAFERVLERMKKSPEDQAILLDIPHVISVRVGHAWDIPANTFDVAYAKFMWHYKHNKGENVGYKIGNFLNNHSRHANPSKQL